MRAPFRVKLQEGRGELLVLLVLLVLLLVLLEPVLVLAALLPLLPCCTYLDVPPEFEWRQLLLPSRPGLAAPASQGQVGSG